MSSLKRLVPEYLTGFEPYHPSQPDAELMKLYGCSRLHRLNNNENPLGPPPKACAVIEQFRAQAASLYPSGDCHYLRLALAQRHGLCPEQVLVGNGANELISFVVKAFCQPGDNVVTAEKTFAVYEWVARLSGVEARLTAEYDEFAMLSLLDERSKVVFLCNPNNPTGGYWSHARLESFLQRLGERALMVVDEAYCEFMESPDYPDSLELCRRYPNLVVFRTFSKMFGLAALRVGYLLGHPEAVSTIARTCVAYSVNALGQQAALAALEDAPEHVKETRTVMRAGREALSGELTRLGLPSLGGEAPFVLCRLPFSDTLAYRKLMQHGYMVRPMTSFRMPRCLRISLGHPEVMLGLGQALEKVLRG